MPRHYTGKISEKIVKKVRPNGDVYVYLRKTQYDRQKGYTVSCGSKLLYKLKPGSDEPVPTRKKRTSAAVCESKRKRIGMMDILDWAGRESGIDDDLRSALGDTSDVQKILSVVRYVVASNGASLTGIETFGLTHELPYVEGISEHIYSKLFKDIGTNGGDIYSKLFKDIGTNGGVEQKYFLCRANRLGADDVLAFDSTTISTYSENILDARYGFNKDHDGLPCIKMATVYSVKGKMPVAYSVLPGNIPDVLSIANVLKQFDYLGVRNCALVTDNGYYSQSNIANCFRHNIKFLTLASASIDYVRTVVENAIPTFGKFVSICPYDEDISAYSETVKHSFHIMRQRSRGDYKANELEPLERKVHVHVYRSETRYTNVRSNFLCKIKDLIERLQSGEREFTDTAQKLINDFLIIKKNKKSTTITVNEEMFEKKMSHAGIFVLVSNKYKDPFEALKWYRLRENIEDSFEMLKNSVGGSKPRVWSDDSFRGKLFCQFIALGYTHFIYQKLESVKAALGEKTGNPEHDTDSNLKAEKGLKKWLEQHSLPEILKWFDCIEETTVQNERGKRRWSTETTARDELFLQKLGV